MFYRQSNHPIRFVLVLKRSENYVNPCTHVIQDAY
jgi:hypothetical protein